MRGRAEIEKEMIRTVTKMPHVVCLVLALAVLLGPRTVFGAVEQRNFDFVVYGATPSGIVTAVAAARQGLRVALISPGSHIGGMVTGGLSTTDRGNVNTIGGIPREFFELVGQHYNERIEFDFEPHVAAQVFEDMLREAKVSVYLDARLRENDGVNKHGAQISSITMEDGAVFSAIEFADCTYEGDLMAEAAVSYTWGREAAAQYGESWAGMLSTNRHENWDHQFPVRVSPFAADGSLLPGVSPATKAKRGEGDKHLPAYDFRMCFTKNKADQAPYPKPDGYDPARYDLLARYLVAMESAGIQIRMSDLMMVIPIRNEKFDVNNHGPISTDNINGNTDFPILTYKQREEMEREHYRYEAGFFYFLAHDPRVPAELQNEVNEYGLAKDEFEDTNNWPWQFYIRESRRMLGEYVITQHDVLENTTKPDSIGMGSYQMDSHNVERFVTPDSAVQNEGDMYLPVTPWEIPYRSIVPERSEAVNLFVTVCLSASHVAYGSYRQEPGYMIAGQAAGTAASIAVRKNVAVQDVSISELQQDLLAAHVVLHWHDFSPPQRGDNLNSN